MKIPLANKTREVWTLKEKDTTFKAFNEKGAKLCKAFNEFKKEYDKFDFWSTPERYLEFFVILEECKEYKVDEYEEEVLGNYDYKNKHNSTLLYEFEKGNCWFTIEYFPNDKGREYQIKHYDEFKNPNNTFSTISHSGEQEDSYPELNGLHSCLEELLRFKFEVLNGYWKERHEKG